MTEKTATNPRGRPSKLIPKLGASPEKIARAVFSAVKPPEPSRRIGKAKQSIKSSGDFRRNA